ncbi:MAG: Fic family protein [Anaerolineaceae bacterium]|nr:Fic family protein [Anaerolineaceae bacterium]
MDLNKFRFSTSGQLVVGPQDYWAFVPNPLPPESLDIDMDLVTLLSRADRALGELSGLGRTLLNPHLLVRPFVRREAVMSSRIEGTRASLSDLYTYEAIHVAQSDTESDVPEVLNYVHALEYGLERLKEAPINLELICELHRLLMDGVRGAKWNPGAFRDGQNWIGAPSSTLETAVYVPPPPMEMLQALDNLGKFINDRNNLPPLILLGLIHYQFEAIHPFYDGNGRVGRLLISLLLCAWGLMSQPLLYLSAYFEADRSDYYAGLLMVSEEGNWKGWLSFFLRGVLTQSQDAIQRIKRLLDIREAYRNRFQHERAAARLLQVVDMLFSLPMLTIRQLENELGVNYPTASRYVNSLVEAEILEEVTGQARYRIFRAGEILDTIEGSFVDVSGLLEL